MTLMTYTAWLADEVDIFEGSFELRSRLVLKSQSHLIKSSLRLVFFEVQTVVVNFSATCGGLIILILRKKMVPENV